MGQSTNGVISYGVTCEEYTEFPWEEHCLDDWWRKVNGFQDLHEPYTPEGQYAEGWGPNDPRLKELWERTLKWEKEHPLPVELENYCRDGCPMYAIVVPDTVLKCGRGFPVSFDPTSLRVTAEQKSDLLVFLKKYEIPYEGEPGWLLTSYWG